MILGLVSNWEILRSISLDLFDSSCSTPEMSFVAVMLCVLRLVS